MHVRVFAPGTLGAGRGAAGGGSHLHSALGEAALGAGHSHDLQTVMNLTLNARVSLRSYILVSEGFLGSQSGGSNAECGIRTGDDVSDESRSVTCLDVKH